MNKHVGVDEYKSVALSNREPKLNNSTIFTLKESVISKTKVEAVEPTKIDECKSVALPNLEPKANNSTVFTSKESVIPKTKVEAAEPTKVTDVMPTGFAESHISSKDENLEERELCL